MAFYKMRMVSDVYFESNEESVVQLLSNLNFGVSSKLLIAGDEVSVEVEPLEIEVLEEDDEI
ncbi:hypothetical protein LCM23_12960 [Cytobacillus kochii]|uniref:hypothetical protein n=1 Tax=Cytobacillus kochii TaxID=859143 RepID=UPI001CD5D114|nr:hypothetical protein [Cytobacillus kochii]MCA1027004.1 hypothetical protein [Cytobacillus kochii]